MCVYALQMALPMSAIAQESANTNSLQSVECDATGLYQFQSVHVNVGPQEKTYKAGEEIEFKGTLINDNDYPVTNGTVFVRIGKNNPDYITDGHNTVAELVALTGVSIPENGSLPVSFVWKAPQNIGAGNYKADYFFSVGNKYNLGGLPFTNEIVVGFSDFVIQNTEVTAFVLDRTATQVNGEKYFHVGNWPTVLKTDAIKFSQPLRNLLDKDIALDVTYDLYYWDSLSAQDKIATKTEKVIVPAKSVIDLTYTVDTITKPVYYLKVTAFAGDVASIANIRVVTDVPGARINYPALTKFPLKAGDSAAMFSCFHAISSDVSSSTLALELTDRDGNVISSGSFKGNISTAMSAVQGALFVGKDYDFAKLKAVLSNEKGEVVDQYEAVYDCAVIQSDECLSVIGNEMVKQITAFAIAALIAALACMWLIRRYKNHPILMRVVYVIGLVTIVISLIAIVLVAARGVGFLQAETVSADGKVKTETRSAAWNWGWTRQGDSRKVGSGTLSYTHNVRLNGATVINVGNTINFSRTGACTFNGTGGAWDTPNCGTALSLSNGGLSASINFPNVTPTMSIASANPNVLSCAGNVCTGRAAGTAVVTATISKMDFAPSGCATTNNVGTICHNSGDDGRRLRLFSGGTYSASSLSLAEYRTSWTIRVSAPNVVNGQCGAQADVCTRGTLSRVPADTSSGNTVTDRWTCLGDVANSSTDDAVCSAQRNNNSGGGGSRNGENDNITQPFPVDFDPLCTVIPHIAEADGQDGLVWAIRDRNDRSFGGYNFTWSYPAPSGVDFRPQNDQAVTMTSDSPVVIANGAVTATVSGGSISKTVSCPSAQFVEGIQAVFSKPIVEPEEMCVLNWSGIDTAEVPVCKIYNEKNEEIKDISGSSSGTQDVEPNDKYYIKCESAPDPENPDAELGFVQSEFLSCIRRGSLIEI